MGFEALVGITLLEALDLSGPRQTHKVDAGTAVSRPRCPETCPYAQSESGLYLLVLVHGEMALRARHAYLPRARTQPL